MADGRTEGASARPRNWLGRRHLMAVYGAFAAYAVAFALLSGGEDRTIDSEGRPWPGGGLTSRSRAAVRG